MTSLFLLKIVLLILSIGLLLFGEVTNVDGLKAAGLMIGLCTMALLVSC
jgi:hypothetical protein